MKRNSWLEVGPRVSGTRNRLRLTWVDIVGWQEGWIPSLRPVLLWSSSPAAPRGCSCTAERPRCWSWSTRGWGWWGPPWSSAWWWTCSPWARCRLPSSWRLMRCIPRSEKGACDEVLHGLGFMSLITFLVVIPEYWCKEKRQTIMWPKAKISGKTKNKQRTNKPVQDNLDEVLQLRT